MNASTTFPRRRLWIGAALAGLLGALAAGCSSRGHNGHGWHRHGHGFHAVRSLDEARERAQDGLKWVLRRLDASDDQARRIRAIADESVAQVYPLMERHRDHRQQLLAALSQPTVDRLEVERLRRAELEIADAASDRLVDAALDAFEVLTPEQRAEVLEHMRDHHR